MNVAVLQARLSRFRFLPAAERRVLMSALLLLPLTAAGLRLIGFRRWRAVLCWALASRNKSLEPNFGVTPQRLAQLVFAASRTGWWTGACLERSLVLWWLLRRRNFAAELRIGARQRSERLEAHAWVQLDNVVLNDDQALVDYVPFENAAEVLGERLR